MKYNQLTLVKRYQILTLTKERYNQKDIAFKISVHPSTISRELKPFKNKEYNPEEAHIQAKLRHIKKPKRKAITKHIEKYIRSKLKEDWSPEQIAGRMKKDTKLTISHETIYQFIYKNKTNGGMLYKHLRHRNKKYHNRLNKTKKRSIIPNKILIDQRSKIVDKKARIGDWEIDTVIGKDHKGAILTIVDKASKFLLIKNLGSKHADITAQATIDLLHPLKDITHTITADNGTEFTYHEKVSQALDIQYYFCDPYSSWQRGLNEHTNGLIRQYLPKKSSFENISQEEVVTIANKLNHRPRKSLGYKTPFEVFMKAFSKKMAA
jgi:IS30 family transposase